MTIVFAHGWSFDANFWAPVIEALPARPTACLEFGHLGAPVSRALPDRPFLAVGHSLGALWLLTRTLPGCVGIVSINGFTRFTTAHDIPHGHPPRMLARTRTTLARDPAATVAAFRTRIGAAAPDPGVDARHLDDGLAHLMDGDGRAAAQMWGAALSRIDGTQDPLVTPDHQSAGFSPTSPHETLEGGHLLPLTQPEACARHIARAWERLS